MTVKVQLEINDELYRQAEALARVTQRSVTTVLAEAIMLEDAIAEPMAEMDLPEESMERERSAFLVLHDQLKKRYLGQYVAIFDQQVVDHDAELKLLYQRIRQKYPDEFVLIRRVEANPEPVYHFRSPRFVRDIG